MITQEEKAALGCQVRAGHAQLSYHYVAVAGVAAAKVWWALDYKSTRGGAGDTEWLRLDNRDIRKLLARDLSLPTVAEARRRLIELGILHARRGENNVVEVRFNWTRIAELLDAVEGPLDDAIERREGIDKNLRSEARARRAAERPKAPVKNLISDPPLPLLVNLPNASEIPAGTSQESADPIRNKNGKNSEEQELASAQVKIGELTEGMRLSGETVSSRTLRNMAKQLAELPAIGRPVAVEALRQKFKDYHEKRRTDSIGWGLAFDDTKAIVAEVAERCVLHERQQQQQAAERAAAALAAAVPKPLPPNEIRVLYLVKGIRNDPPVRNMNLTRFADVAVEAELDAQRAQRNPECKEAALRRWDLPVLKPPTSKHAPFTQEWVLDYFGELQNCEYDVVPRKPPGRAGEQPQARATAI